jgi:hypothetical protein
MVVLRCGVATAFGGIQSSSVPTGHHGSNQLMMYLVE